MAQQSSTLAFQTIVARGSIKQGAGGMVEVTRVHPRLPNFVFDLRGGHR